MARLGGGVWGRDAWVRDAWVRDACCERAGLERASPSTEVRRLSVGPIGPPMALTWGVGPKCYAGLGLGLWPGAAAGRGEGSKCRAPAGVLEADREDVRVVLVVEHRLWVRARGGVGWVRHVVRVMVRLRVRFRVRLDFGL